MSFKPCQRYCNGLCPCPDPPWEWRCKQIPVEIPKRNPQKRWISAMIKRWMKQP